MTKVFLSYARGDEPFVSELRTALLARGAFVFDASKDIALARGTDISTLILQHLKQSDLVVFVVPRYQGEGKTALFELGAAKALGKRIVSVLPENARVANNDVASAFGSSFYVAGRSVESVAEQVLSEQAAA